MLLFILHFFTDTKIVYENIKKTLIQQS